MIFALVCWLLIWGGMFTDVVYLKSSLFPSDFHTLFQGVRAFFPLLALYLSFMWVLFRRARFPFFKDPLGLLFAYGGLGVFISLSLSSDPWRSAYWAAIYVAPFVVFWMVYTGEESLRRLKIIINLNYFVFFALTFSLLPSAIRVGKGLASAWQVYKLPLALGVVNRNGVGRYALIVIIVSAVRLISQHNIRRWLWLLPIFPAGYLLAQTESRTALLGLAVITVVFFLLKGINLRFLLLMPLAFSLIYTVGFRTRAHGQLNQLVYLTGREGAWIQGIQWIKESPWLGWGFHADRIMMNEAHMHNSYLHAAIQEGAVGFLLFVAAFVGIWALMLWKNVFKVSRNLKGQDQVFLIESVLIVAFLTSRSFFESTAAFYGVDLLLIIPAMAFISLMLKETGSSDVEPEASP